MNRNEKDKTNRSVFPDGTSIAEKKSENVMGVVKVHESVIASIIRKAACSAGLFRSACGGPEHRHRLGPGAGIVR